MPFSKPTLRELLAITYAASGTSTTTSGSGAALATNPLGGNFTIANRTSVEIVVDLPFNSLATAAAGSFVQLFLMLDGTTPISDRFLPISTSGYGMPCQMRCRLSGLSVGAHAIAIWMKVSGSTGSVVGSAASPGLLTVTER